MVGVYVFLTESIMYRVVIGELEVVLKLTQLVGDDTDGLSVRSQSTVRHRVN